MTRASKTTRSPRSLAASGVMVLMGFSPFAGCGESDDPAPPSGDPVDGGDGGAGVAITASGGGGGVAGASELASGGGAAAEGGRDGGIAALAGAGGASDGGEGGAIGPAIGGAPFAAGGAGGAEGDHEGGAPVEGGAAGATATTSAGGAGASGAAGEEEQCDPGYRLVGGLCRDVNECAASTRNDCAPDRICINTTGSYTCACPSGSNEDPAGECISLCAHRDFDGASIVLSIGHLDAIAAAYDAQARELRLFVSDDSFPLRQPEPVLRTPENVLLHGKPTAKLVVPDVPALAGILEPGTEIWLLPEGQPEAQAAGLVWPGFQSYGVGVGVLQGDQAVVRLLSHEGNGRFLGFANPQDEITPPALYLDPLNDGNEFALPANTHLHMNWGFAEDGVHRLIFELEATTLDGELVSSEPRTYRFFFGELAALPATEPTIVVPLGLAESYVSGADLRLTAARYGMPSALPAAWARQCQEQSSSEPGPWQALGEGDELLTTAKAGCQYIACLMDGETVAAVSQPVSALVE